MIDKILPKLTDAVSVHSEGTLVGYVNIFNYMAWRKEPDLVRNFDSLTLDGIMLAVFIRIFYRKKLSRQSPDFSSYFRELFESLDRDRKKVFLVGGNESEVAAAERVMQEAYPGIEFVGRHSGFYDAEEKVIEQVMRARPDVCIAGMGTPRQERFLVALKSCGYQGSGFSCGAFISQTADGGKAYYPKWINKLHMRWVYRIYKEPKLFRRYTVDYPKGLYYLLRDTYR